MLQSRCLPVFKAEEDTLWPVPEEGRNGVPQQGQLSRPVQVVARNVPGVTSLTILELALTDLVRVKAKALLLI